MANTTCLSVRAIGTFDEPEQMERAIELKLPVGEVGVAGSESSADVVKPSAPPDVLGPPLC